MDVIEKCNNKCLYFAHFITKDQLNDIISCVDEKISKKIAKIKMKKYQNEKFYIIGEMYDCFIEKTYFLFNRIPFFTLQWRKVIDIEFTKIWSIFGVRIFMVQEAENRRKYYFLYIPVLTIAQR
jgi:hypothetical protein